MIVRDLIPPAARQIAGRLRAPEITAEQFFMELAKAPYDDARLMEGRVSAARRTLNDPAHIGCLLLAMAVGATGRPAHVLDFGGAFGEHSAPLRRMLGPRVASYTVVELPSVVAAARHAGFTHASFAQDIPVVPTDVVFSSGTLQCLPDPIDTLDQLAALGAPFLVLARTCISDEPLYFSRRTTAGQSIPLRAITRHDLGATLAAYETLATVPNDTGLPRRDRRLTGSDILMRRR